MFSFSQKNAQDENFQKAMAEAMQAADPSIRGSGDPSIRRRLVDPYMGVDQYSLEGWGDFSHVALKYHVFFSFSSTFPMSWVSLIVIYGYFYGFSFWVKSRM